MRFVLSLLILFTMGNLQAQNKKELSKSLLRDLEDYRRLTVDMNFDSSYKFKPPNMFGEVCFDSIKGAMLQTMDNEYMKVKMTGMDYTAPEKVKVKKAGKYYWAIAPYSSTMIMELKGDPEFKKTLIPILKGQFGHENVKMEGESTMLITLKNKNLIAFREPGAPNWYLIEDHREEKGGNAMMQKAIYQSVVPEEVRESIEKD
jgi:hypothetical protein